MDENKICRYIKNRLDYQINYYDSRSSKYKKRYYIWQSISIIAAAAIPVLAGDASYSKWIVLLISFLGALTGIIQSILSLTKIRNNWLLYRFISENLKTEKIEFKNNCYPYMHKDLERNFHLLVGRCEHIMNSEHDNEHDKWFNRNTRRQ